MSQIGESVTPTAGPEGWPEVLDRYGVRFLALDLDLDADLLRAFRSHAGWAVQAEDQEGVLLARIGFAAGAGEEGTAVDSYPGPETSAVRP